MSDGISLEPVAWQRRRLYALASDAPGKRYEWEACSHKEATGHFEREPGCEYRPLYTSDAIQAAVAAERARIEQNWDGLARQIMMAFDCDAKTPCALFKFLERCGYDVPQWMRDEAEMQNLDHVISKGTRCVLIARAMSAIEGTDLESPCHG